MRSLSESISDDEQDCVEEKQQWREKMSGKREIEEGRKSNYMYQSMKDVTSKDTCVNMHASKRKR